MTAAPLDSFVRALPPRRLVQAMHLARQLGVALLTRPISFGNLSYVHECVRSFVGIRTTTLGIDVAEGQGWGALRRQFLIQLDAVIRHCTEPTIRQLVGLLDGAGYREYLGPILARLRGWPRRGVLAQKAYRQLIFVVGPGIGVGDEIATVPFFQAIRSRFPDAETRVFTFFPGVWRSLVPELPCESLIDNPLGSYDAIEALIQADLSRQLLVVQATFIGLDMLQSYAPERHGADFLELAVGRAQLSWLPAEGHGHWDHSLLHAAVPGIGRGLEEAVHFLLEPGDPRGREARTRRTRVDFSRPEAATRQRPDGVFRVFLNPFTSKEIRLTPEDWARWLVHVRRRLPVERPLACALYPGLTETCLAYSRAIETHARRLWPGPGLGISLLTDPAGALPPGPQAVPTCYRYMREADLVLGMDTFTAHLAASTSAVSIALCLTRNRLFWQLSPQTLWVDMRVGDATLTRLYDLVLEVLLNPLALQPDGRDVAARCRRVVELGRPEWLLWTTQPRVQLDALRAVLDAVWADLPPDLQALFFRLDTDFAWPLLSQELEYRDASESELEAACLKLSTTLFYRLICLQGRGEVRS